VSLLAGGFPLAIPSSAIASDKPTVVLLGVHGDGKQGQETLGLLADELVAGFMTSSLEPLHGAALAGRLAQVREVLPERVFLWPVREAVAEGKELYRRANPEKAVAVLSAVLPLLEAHRDFLRSPQLAVELYLHLGLAQLNLGKTVEAERSFEQVARIDPNRVLDDLNYSPKLVDAYARVRNRVTKDRSAAIVVALPGEDPGARVYVDGRLVGTTPITAGRLIEGDHLVVVDAGELGMTSTTVTLTSGQRLDLPIELAPGSLAIPDEAFCEPGDPVVRALYRQIVLASGADLVAVASFDRVGDFHLALYSPRSDSFSIDVSASLDAAPGPRAAFIRQLVSRVTRSANTDGNIRPDQMALQGPSLRLRDNHTLDGVLWPRPSDEPNPEESIDDDASANKVAKPVNKKALGVLGAILGGSLAAIGLGFGVDAALREAGERPPSGVLIVTVP
jgi:hypothetical protein